MVTTRNYRTNDSYESATRAETPVGGILRITVPLPPSTNKMNELLSSSLHGKQYAKVKNKYKENAMLQLLAFGHRKPGQPWERIALMQYHFRLASLRDEMELPASCKWPLDMLVQAQWFRNDSPKHFKVEALPTYEYTASNHGIDMWFRRDA